VLNNTRQTSIFIEFFGVTKWLCKSRISRDL
jgi:hypothetical protein